METTAPQIEQKEVPGQSHSLTKDLSNSFRALKSEFEYLDMKLKLELKKVILELISSLWKQIIR